jgi:hypothetical protein
MSKLVRVIYHHNKPISGRHCNSKNVKSLSDHAVLPIYHPFPSNAGNSMPLIKHVLFHKGVSESLKKGDLNNISHDSDNVLQNHLKMANNRGRNM